ncbi:MAG: response regulator transcription factor, partial [Anaerolineae bacterium]|nr:response regulator transcription factor [Anaerolineae bacterium]
MCIRDRLWDLGWDPGPALGRLAEQWDELPPVVALAPDASTATAAWQAGARGLLRRDLAPEQLVAALTAVAEGLAVIEPTFASSLWLQSERSPFGPDTETPSPIEPLTPRELEVLRLMAEGLPNKTIARRLGISEHTVKFHVNAILGKLGVAGRTEAVVRATRLGLILL